MSTRIFLIGTTGRVGQEIAALCAKSKDFEIVGGWSQDKKDFSINGANVIIDFSSADLFAEVLQWSRKTKTALVSGTTGLSEGDFAAMKSAAAEIPVLWSANMSIGINFLLKLIKQYGALEDFDFQIEETHHRHKKDAPSGTALVLQKALQEQVAAPLPPPLAIRGGGVFGVHKIWALSEEEVIGLEHQALNRTVFAKGALKAAAWMKNRGAGLYTMSDVLEGA